jgi:hypothetical protein
MARDTPLELFLQLALNRLKVPSTAALRSALELTDLKGLAFLGGFDMVDSQQDQEMD